MNSNVLIISIGFRPNMGGLETHLDDLIKFLIKSQWRPIILTYKPVTTKTPALVYEKNNDIEIIRIPWFGNLFYKLVKNPILEFLYLTPGLMFVLPILLLIKRNIKVIHSHGLIAGFPSVFWGKLFGIRVITTTHSIYHFPAQGLYRSFARWIFKNSDCVLTLSKQSRQEVLELGINLNKVRQFTYWVNLEHFKRVENAKQLLRWPSIFTILFVGRLVPEKGLRILLGSACAWGKNINLAIAGIGPLLDEVVSYTKKCEHIFYLGNVSPGKIPVYYSAADLLIVPSIHEEGFGRVIIESLACGTPVIGSNRGAIPEAMDESVGRLINITHRNIKKTVEGLYKNKNILSKLSKNCQVYAKKRYGEKNAQIIINSYAK